jgi:hypothetical protein
LIKQPRAGERHEQAAALAQVTHQVLRRLLPTMRPLRLGSTVA